VFKPTLDKHFALSQRFARAKRQPADEARNRGFASEGNLGGDLLLGVQRHDVVMANDLHFVHVFVLEQGPNRTKLEQLSSRLRQQDLGVNAWWKISAGAQSGCFLGQCTFDGSHHG
jgi:hypothetical protein